MALEHKWKPDILSTEKCYLVEVEKEGLTNLHSVKIKKIKETKKNIKVTFKKVYYGFN